MWFAGFSLDNLSLMALTIGTGFVVDDAIVMIENIVRHMEEGESPFEAALRGAREIGFTIISLTVSLIAVFIPLLFMTGLVGRMFREFALTLTIAVVVSVIVSLTLTPMMCAKLLRHEHGSGGNRVTRWFNGLVDGSVAFYGRSLEWVLRHQTFTLVVTVVTLLATIWLYVVMPKGFLPLQDTGLITAVTEAGTEVSFAEMQRLQKLVSDRIRAGPGRDRRRVGGRREPAQRDAECRAHVDHAASRAANARPWSRDHLAAEGAHRRHSGHDGLLPARAGHPDFDPPEPRAVPVHAGRNRRRRGGAVVGPARRGAAR